MKKENVNINKPKISSEPFHPITKNNFIPFQNNFMVPHAGYFYSGNQMPYLQKFKSEKNENRFLRPFKNKQNQDQNYYRKDYRFRKLSGSQEKPEDFSNKYKTEICKNFELTRKCKWGDMVSIKIP